MVQLKSGIDEWRSFPLQVQIVEMVSFGKILSKAFLHLDQLTRSQFQNKFDGFSSFAFLNFGSLNQENTSQKPWRLANTSEVSPSYAWPGPSPLDPLMSGGLSNLCWRRFENIPILKQFGMQQGLHGLRLWGCLRSEQVSRPMWGQPLA